MTFVWILPLLVLDSIGVSKAQQLYERARYERALQVLGPTCDGAADPIACERLRALIHIAIGEVEMARAAFGRMLARDPELSLGSDVSPKVQSLFAAAKREVQELANLEIEPVTVPDDEGTWVLKVYRPNADGLVGVTAHIALEPGDDFQTVELALQGDAFVGVVEGEVPDGESTNYYLVARVAGGLEIEAGNSTSPLTLPVRVGETQFPVTSGGGGAVELPGLEDGDDEGGLPNWAFWSLVGGGTAAVALSITLAILLSGGDEPGTVDVKINYGVEP